MSAMIDIERDMIAAVDETHLAEEWQGKDNGASDIFYMGAQKMSGTNWE